MIAGEAAKIGSGVTAIVARPSLSWFMLMLQIIFSPGYAVAMTDLSVGFDVRSYPLSGVVESELGYDGLLWGSAGGGGGGASSASRSPWYGYVRPLLEGSTALTYNSLGAALEFFPISFLGARAGGEGIQNDEDYRAYDCVASMCRGRFYRSYVQAELSLGVGPLFGQVTWRREHWVMQSAGSLPFIEPTTGLNMFSGGDFETIYRALVGYKIDPEWSAIAAVAYAQSSVLYGISRFPVAILRHASAALSYGVGLGVFSSPLKPSEVSCIAFLQWQILPSLALQ